LHKLTNENGLVCVTIDIIQEDGSSRAIRVFWKDGVDGFPELEKWNEAIDSCIAECRENGAAFIDSRVITANEGVTEALAAARASMHRDSLRARGFRQGESRLEYNMGVDEALTALSAGSTEERLAWNCIEAENENELILAAGILRRASQGDPASHEEDDALGFLENLLEEPEAVRAPERIQIGTCEGAPAAFLALIAYPVDGWSSIHYMGVLPEYRGRGFGAEVMLHGLRCLKAMGGKIYHDGTGSRNTSALALFERLGKPPFRAMEEWRMEVSRDTSGLPD